METGAAAVGSTFTCVQYLSACYYCSLPTFTLQRTWRNNHYNELKSLWLFIMQLLMYMGYRATYITHNNAIFIWVQHKLTKLNTSSLNFVRRKKNIYMSLDLCRPIRESPICVASNNVVMGGGGGAIAPPPQ